MSDYREDNTQVEFITIVEGPTPDFLPISTDDWPWSLDEGPDSAMVAVCKLRTLDGETMVARCRNAWERNRPVRLDYPDGEGGRHEADVVAVRMETVEEGDVLHLWVSL